MSSDKYEVRTAELPWSWNPIERRAQEVTLLDGLVFDERFDESNGQDSVSGFLYKATRQYIVPDPVASMLSRTVLGLTAGECGDLLVVDQTEQEEVAKLQRFEQDILGLEPTDSVNGLHWYGSPASFGGARYTIASIAKAINARPERIKEAISSTPGLWAMIRANNFLFEVYDLENSDSEVHVDVVTELTDLGSAVVEAALEAYAVDSSR